MSQVKFDVDRLRSSAEGRWVEVLEKLAPSLRDALAKAPRHTACPCCGGRDRFRFYRDVAKSGGAYCNQCVNPRTGKQGFGNGFDLLMWINGWSFPATLEAVAGVVGLEGNASSGTIRPRDEHPRPAQNDGPVERHVGSVDRPAPTTRAPLSSRSNQGQGRAFQPKGRIEPVLNDMEDLARVKRIRNSQKEIWKAAAPLSHPDALPARLYLYNRGLNSIPWENDQSVRFHPALAYWESGVTGNLRKVGEFPCLVFRVVDTNGLTVTLHRIYLTPDGNKAPVDEPKKLMEVPKDRSMIGSAIRLGGTGPVLGIAEGPETALAVHLATGMPVWSAVSASFLPHVFPATEETVEERVEAKGFMARVTTMVRRPEPVRRVKRTGVTLPEGVEAVAIWADLDRSQAGESAAKDLKRVLMTGGVQTQIWLPPVVLPEGVKSLDWLDVFVELGRSGFPRSALAHQLRVA